MMYHPRLVVMAGEPLFYSSDDERPLFLRLRSSQLFIVGAVAFSLFTVGVDVFIVNTDLKLTRDSCRMSFYTLWYGCASRIRNDNLTLFSWCLSCRQRLSLEQDFRLKIVRLTSRLSKQGV